MCEYKLDYNLDNSFNNKINRFAFDNILHKPLQPKNLNILSDHSVQKDYYNLCSFIDLSYHKYITDYKTSNEVERAELFNNLNYGLCSLGEYAKEFVVFNHGPFLSFKICEKIVRLLNDPAFIIPSEQNDVGIILKLIVLILSSSKTDTYISFTDLGLADRLWKIADEHVGIVYEYALQGLVELTWFSPDSSRSVLQEIDYDILPHFFDLENPTIKSPKTIFFYSEIFRYTLKHITDSDIRLVELICGYFNQILWKHITSAKASAYIGLAQAISNPQYTENVWSLLTVPIEDGNRSRDTLTEILVDCSSNDLTTLQSVYRLLSTCFKMHHNIPGINCASIVENLDYKAQEDIGKFVVKEASNLLFEIIFLNPSLTDIIIDFGAIPKMEISFEVAPFDSKYSILKLICLMAINSSEKGKRKLISYNIIPPLLYSLALEENELTYNALRAILFLINAGQRPDGSNIIVNSIRIDENKDNLYESLNSDEDNIQKLAQFIIHNYVELKTE